SSTIPFLKFSSKRIEKHFHNSLTSKRSKGIVLAHFQRREPRGHGLHDRIGPQNRIAKRKRRSMQPYRYLRMKLRMRAAFPLLPCVALSLMIGFLSSCGGSSATPVPPPTNLFVKPSAATVVQGGTQLFATGAQVKWSVQEGVAGGSVSDTGSYTAPNAAGTYHVVATSTDGSVGKATVTVPAVAISASVNSVPIAIDDSVSMSNFASVSGTVNTKIIWAVQEGSAGGSISLSAVYTAPSTLGTYHVVAKSE